jgi:hypothetical protein
MRGSITLRVAISAGVIGLATALLKFTRPSRRVDVGSISERP